ncbi:histone-lysine N-methyltransferase SETMAR [Trichonephila clavipes]|nr:histone-lysine N-methyltransferase SETMAR [Trichonephila clavipes]
MGPPFYPETKASYMEWKQPSSSLRKKFETNLSAKKVLLTVFWDKQGVFLLDFLEVGTINATRYCDTLLKLVAMLKSNKHFNASSLSKKRNSNMKRYRPPVFHVLEKNSLRDDNSRSANPMRECEFYELFENSDSNTDFVGFM